MSRFPEIKQLLLSRELKAALDILKELSIAYQCDSLLNRIEEIEQTYYYLLSYLLNGVDDPERSNLTVGLIAQAFDIAHQLEDQIEQREAKNYYYISLRNGQAVLQKPINSFLRQFGEIADQELYLSVDKSHSQVENKLLQMRYQHEQLQIELFQKGWLSPIWTAADYEDWHTFLTDPSITESTNLLIVSGLTLSLWRRFDAKKLTLLMSIYPQSTGAMRCRVLISMILSLYTHREILPFFPALRRHFNLIADEKNFKSEMKIVLKEIMRLQETDRVTRKMKEEIIPEMLKITPKILKKIRPNEHDELNHEDLNPDWNDILEDRSITDTIEELGKLQKEGADIYMSTFASMKMYPFFNQIANWFLPFDPNHTVFRYGINPEKKGSISVTNRIALSDMLCNSDKYSMSLTMIQMPVFQKEALLTQFNLDQEGDFSDKTVTEKESRSTQLFVQHYMRDLYRFFKLYPNKGSFQESFQMPQNLLSIDWLASLWQDQKIVEELAKFSFEKAFFSEANELYQHLKRWSPMDHKIAQRCGYSLQMLGQDAAALTEYECADSLHPNDYWTVKRLAFTYKKVKANNRALEYFLLADRLRPDQAVIALHLGHLFLEQKNYADALNYYFKAEYLFPNQIRSWRPIAWCSFLTQKFTQAERYYTLILDSDPLPDDYINAGHTALALCKNRDAIHLYQIGIQKGMSWNEWCEMLDHDRNDLIAAGIKTELIDALPDLVLYEWNQNISNNG